MFSISLDGQEAFRVVLKDSVRRAHDREPACAERMTPKGLLSRKRTPTTYCFAGPQRHHAKGGRRQRPHLLASAYPRGGDTPPQGKEKRVDVRVESVVISPMATHGEGFSSFNWNLMPIDLTFIGVAHSHPSGYAVPASQQDLLHMMGKIMVIMGYPYTDESCIKVYDIHGRPLAFQVSEAPPDQSLSDERNYVED